MNYNWIVDLDELEPLCICLRTKTCYSYFYPFQKEVWKRNAKIVTRDGRVVKKVRMGYSNGTEVIVGILDGEELKWDEAGRFNGPYVDDVKDLYIQEKFFYKDWKNNIHLSNAEWEMRFGRQHPYVKKPE